MRLIALSSAAITYQFDLQAWVCNHLDGILRWVEDLCPYRGSTPAYEDNFFDLSIADLVPMFRAPRKTELPRLKWWCLASELP